MLYHCVCSPSQNTFILKQGEPLSNRLFSNSRADFSTQEDVPAHPQVFCWYLPPEKHHPLDLWGSAAGFWIFLQSPMPRGTQFFTGGSWDQVPATEQTWTELQHHTRTSYFKNKCRKIKNSHKTKGLPFFISRVSPQSQWHRLLLSSAPHLYLFIFKALYKHSCSMFVCFSSFKLFLTVRKASTWLRNKGYTFHSESLMTER